MSNISRVATQAGQFKFDNGNKDLYDYFVYTDYEYVEDEDLSYKTSDQNGFKYNKKTDDKEVPEGYISGFEPWNEVLNTGYFIGDDEVKVVSPGTRPSPAFIPDGDSTQGIRGPIKPADASIEQDVYLPFQTKHGPSNTELSNSGVTRGHFLWATGKIGRDSDSGMIEIKKISDTRLDISSSGVYAGMSKSYSPSDFADGVIPSRLFIELQAAGGGGAGGSNLLEGIEGGGGSGGGYWCGVIDISKLHYYSDQYDENNERRHCVRILLGPSGIGRRDKISGDDAKSSEIQYHYEWYNPDPGDDEESEGEFKQSLVICYGGIGGEYVKEGGGAPQTTNTWVISYSAYIPVYTRVAGVGGAGGNEHIKGGDSGIIGIGPVWGRYYSDYLQCYDYRRFGLGGIGTATSGGSGGGGGASFLWDGGADTGPDDSTRNRNKEGLFGSGGAGGDDGSWVVESRRTGGNGGCAVAIIHFN